MQFSYITGFRGIGYRSTQKHNNLFDISNMVNYNFPEFGTVFYAYSAQYDAHGDKIFNTVA